MDRVKQSGVRDYIRINNYIHWVSYSEEDKTFTVTVKDLKKDELYSKEYDYVVVATGHFSTPNVPYFEGFEHFPGRILHAHDFRDACEFEGKNRSEEHTSELQSRGHLVCRLLLEKKKIK